MKNLTPEQKADYLISVFNGNIQSGIIVCNEMITQDRGSEYYQKVKEILISKRDNNPLKDKLLSVNYLILQHPEINEKQAKELLIFCQAHTIRHEECYGDGSIMFPMWNESIK